MPIDRERILQSAQKYVDRKRYDKAIEEYHRIVQDDPNDARTWLKIGDLQSRMQAYADAVATYDRVGQYYSAQGFALKAIAVYKQIREIIRKHAPDLAARYRHVAPKLAEIYTQLGLTSDALAAYDEVATSLQREGRDREAIAVFQTMVALDRTNPLPHLRFAEACCRVQAVDEAIEAFWTAAELLLRLERRDDALKVVERIMHFRQDPRFARVAAELYLARGQREDGLAALAKLQICFQADPKNLDTLSLLAQAFTIIGQADKAIEVYKEMARLARDQGKEDLFADLLRHLLSVAPDDEQVRALHEQARPVSEPAPDTAVDLDEEVELLDDEVDDLEDEETIAPPEVAAASSRSPLRSGPDVVVVEPEYEAAEPLDEAPEPLDLQLRKALSDAESFRRLRLYPKAIEALQNALAQSPRSREARERLRQVLREAGDHAGALEETLTLAAQAHQEGDDQHAEALLYEVLELEPEHPAALALLERVSGAEYLDAEEDIEPESVAPEAPLPSYDLEEMRPSRAMARPSDRTDPTLLDDPFELNAPSEHAALPSFPLSSEDDLLVGSSEVPTGRPPMPSELAPPSTVSASVAPYSEQAPLASTPRTPAPPTGRDGVEEALEEAEFFASRGLYDDARAILNDQLRRSPRHPLVLEKLREVDEARAENTTSGTIERSQLGQNEPEDAVFDIAASLEALDELPAGRSAVGSFASIDEEVDVDQVFAKFKEGVRAQVEESDSATHYDLGVAYKEMGLLADAIHEFEIAAKDRARECMCYAMIGLIRLENNELDLAAAMYKRALNARDKTVDQEMSLYYDLGNVCEMKRQLQEALYYFQRIARRDPGYRDVKERIAALQPKRAPQPAARAVNDDDEFERAFGELFNNK